MAAAVSDRCSRSLVVEPIPGWNSPDNGYTGHTVLGQMGNCLRSSNMEDAWNVFETWIMLRSVEERTPYNIVSEIHQAVWKDFAKHLDASGPRRTVHNIVLEICLKQNIFQNALATKKQSIVSSFTLFFSRWIKRAPLSLQMLWLQCLGLEFTLFAVFDGNMVTMCRKWPWAPQVLRASWHVLVNVEGATHVPTLRTAVDTKVPNVLCLACGSGSLLTEATLSQMEDLDPKQVQRCLDIADGRFDYYDGGYMRDMDAVLLEGTARSVSAVRTKVLTREELPEIVMEVNASRAAELNAAAPDDSDVVDGSVRIIEARSMDATTTKIETAVPRTEDATVTKAGTEIKDATGTPTAITDNITWDDVERDNALMEAVLRQSLEEAELDGMIEAAAARGGQATPPVEEVKEEDDMVSYAEYTDRLRFEEEAASPEALVRRAIQSHVGHLPEQVQQPIFDHVTANGGPEYNPDISRTKINSAVSFYGLDEDLVDGHKCSPKGFSNMIRYPEVTLNRDDEEEEKDSAV